MTIDPRTPVLVAVGEVTSRAATVVDPIDLATEATRRAFADAGVPIGHRIDTVATPGILMIGRDHPASRIAEAAGLRAPPSDQLPGRWEHPAVPRRNAGPGHHVRAGRRRLDRGCRGRQFGTSRHRRRHPSRSQARSKVTTNSWAMPVLV
jgi:hypothetical protein